MDPNEPPKTLRNPLDPKKPIVIQKNFNLNNPREPKEIYIHLPKVDFNFNDDNNNKTNIIFRDDEK